MNTEKNTKEKEEYDLWDDEVFWFEFQADMIHTTLTDDTFKSNRVILPIEKKETLDKLNGTYKEMFNGELVFEYDNQNKNIVYIKLK